ncbi:MAG: hypothetical protein R2856_34685 [Caldilineaceae bacterium]
MNKKNLQPKGRVGSVWRRNLLFVVLLAVVSFSVTQLSTTHMLARTIGRSHRRVSAVPARYPERRQRQPIHRHAGAHTTGADSNAHRPRCHGDGNCHNRCADCHPTSPAPGDIANYPLCPDHDINTWHADRLRAAMSLRSRAQRRSA